MNSLLPALMKDFKPPRKTVPLCPHCGNIVDSAIIANHDASTFTPSEAAIIGRLTFVKQHKKFWLLPVIIVLLLLGILAVTDPRIDHRTDALLRLPFASR